jgi:hypothetical protein
MNRLTELQNIGDEKDFKYSVVFHMYNYKSAIMVCSKSTGFFFSFPAMEVKHSNPAGCSAETRPFLSSLNT